MRFLPVFLFLLLCQPVFSQDISIIPQPVELKQSPGSYTLKNKMTVSSSFPAGEWENLFAYFKAEMKKQFGITLTPAAAGTRGDIDFFMKRMPTSGKPAYTLDVTTTGILINSNFNEPAFHAIQTLFQLMPVDPVTKKTIPLVSIFDHARLQYRGMHLDCARHFWPVDFIKRYIDYLAFHKLNTFHWHLTDDQGWRIEIKKYPKLTSVGGWRNGTIIGRYPGKGNDGQKYGGYYTQEQVKEIVQYAKERFVDVIPEIEMPGHASAAIAAYPELSCFPKEPTIQYFPKNCSWSGDSTGKQVQQTWGVFDDVFCAGQDKTFAFIQDVLDELMPLFPSKYIHVGGDECPKENWKRCADCQKRMQENKLKDEHELQSYFIQRMEKYLNSKGRTLIGWDEILEGGLAPNAVVMSWRGEKGGIEAAKQQHQVIMTPGTPVYFDYSQSANEDSVTIGGYNPIEKVYAWNPVPAELTEEEGKFILGAQANVWTEYMKNTRKVEYMIFPRMAALSEVLWSTPENKDWKKFESRLMTQFKRYERWNANYSKAYFDLIPSILPSPDYKGVIWKLDTKMPAADIKYITHYAGRPYALRFTEGTTYTTPITIQSDMLIAAISMKGNKALGNPVYETFHFNKATGKKISLSKEASKNYPGDGAFTLVNAVVNEKGMARTREFLGFSGDDCVATIDLGANEKIGFVKVHYLHQPGSWIYQPGGIRIEISEDGNNYSPIPLSNQVMIDGQAPCEFQTPVNARFVRVSISNYGLIPSGNPGAGNKAWLFVSEIEVN